MKIAILLSGHVRSFQKTHKNFEKRFLNNLKSAGHEYDIYISTWDTDGEKSQLGGGSAPIFVKDLDTDLVAPELLRIYNPIKLEVEATPPQDFLKFAILAKSLRRKYPKLNNKIQSEKHRRLNSPKHIKGVLSQLYKIKKAYELIEEPNEYDIIIKYRFDLFIEDLVDWENEEFINRISTALYLRTKNKIYPDGTTSWGDTMVMGPPDLMKYFCLAYDYITDFDKELLLRHAKLGDVDIFTITHIVNSIFDTKGIKDKLCLYTKGNYQPYGSYILRSPPGFTTSTQ